MVFQGKLRNFNGKSTGICPFHKEKTASFTIYSQENRAICYGCRWRGDVIQYVMELGDIGFVEAIKELTTYA
jgi:DNA primase